MIAVCMIRRDPHYRRQAFTAGLRKAGYTVRDYGDPKDRNDLLIIWNRYGEFEHKADAWERKGGTVLVCENGYAGADAGGRQYYAISVHGHNGSGWYPDGDGTRFDALGLTVYPWKDGGECIVVRGQRGIGSRTMASPVRWHNNAAAKLSNAQRLPVRMIEHPGRHTAHPPPSEYLSDAAACVIWASSVGVTALLMGVPVFYDAPYWICQPAARRLSDSPDLGNPLRDDALRRYALERMAWAQWSVDEIESGEPFVRLTEYPSFVQW